MQFMLSGSLITQAFKTLQGFSGNFLVVKLSRLFFSFLKKLSSSKKGIFYFSECKPYLTEVYSDNFCRSFLNI